MFARTLSQHFFFICITLQKLYGACCDQELEKAGRFSWTGVGEIRNYTATSPYLLTHIVQANVGSLTYGAKVCLLLLFVFSTNENTA